MSVAEILPGATLGVIGGGQLGRMFVHAAQQLGSAGLINCHASQGSSQCLASQATAV